MMTDTFPDELPGQVPGDMDAPEPSAMPGGNILAAFMGGLFPGMAGLFAPPPGEKDTEQSKTVNVSPLPLPVKIETTSLPNAAPGTSQFGTLTNTVQPPPLPLVDLEQELPAKAPAQSVLDSASINGGVPAAMPQGPVDIGFGAGSAAPMPAMAIPDVAPSFIPSADYDVDPVMPAGNVQQQKTDETLRKLTDAVEELTNAMKEAKRQQQQPGQPGQQQSAIGQGMPPASAAPGQPRPQPLYPRGMPPAHSGLPSPWLAAIMRRG